MLATVSPSFARLPVMKAVLTGILSICGKVAFCAPMLNARTGIKIPPRFGIRTATMIQSPEISVKQRPNRVESDRPICASQILAVTTPAKKVITGKRWVTAFANSAPTRSLAKEHGVTRHVGNKNVIEL
jgi:hypothetical protein